MTISSKTSPFTLLLNRVDEKLSRGAFERHASIEESDRTRHRFAWIDVAARGELTKVPSPLGFGYLQAVLSVLRLVPVYMSYDAPGLSGRLIAKGTETYHFSWNENDGVACLQGGFIYGGKPNYYSAMLGLTQAIAMYLSGERLQSEEVVTAWCSLLMVMETAFPRTSQQWGWPEKAISEACLLERTRHSILYVCDSLRAAMQYHLAAKSKREVLVCEADVLEADQGTTVEIPGYKLLDSRWLLATATSAPLLPTPHPVTEILTEASKEVKKPSEMPEETPSESSSSSVASTTSVSPSSVTATRKSSARSAPASSLGSKSWLSAKVRGADWNLHTNMN